MIAALNIFRLAARPCKAAQPPAPMFEVQLVGLADHGLTFLTSSPMQVAGALMRDRDPSQWDTRIRALGTAERPV